MFRSTETQVDSHRNDIETNIGGKREDFFESSCLFGANCLCWEDEPQVKVTFSLVPFVQSVPSLSISYPFPAVSLSVRSYVALNIV